MAILNMANAADTEKIRQIDKGIENAQRFEDVLASGEFSEEEQGKLISVPDKQFVQILKERGLGDIIGLKDARRDYFLYKDTKTPQLPQVETEKEQGKGLNPAEAAGVLLGLGMTPFMRSGLTPEMLETSSKDYAEKAATEWNKTKDYSKAKSYFHAFEMAQQDYFDRFAYTDPKAAKKLANFQTQKFVQRALLRNRLLKEEGVKGFVARSFAPNYEQVAENRLRMIDKLAEMRASEVSTKDEEREKLLRNFADDDPVTFQHHINQQRTQGKSLDPLMEKVIADKITAEQRLAERTKLSQERREQKQQTTPAPTNQPAKKPGRISSIRGGLGRLNNLRPSSIASKTARKVGSSILNFLTRLLKKALIGGVMGAISSLVSGAISALIGFGTAIASALAFILAKLSIVIGAVTGLSISTAILIVSGAIVLAFLIFAAVAFFQAIFPSTSPTPHRGISYVITPPISKIENGELIGNRIAFFYFSEATCPIENITLVDELPNGSNLVSATGNYTTTLDPLETVRWKIYPENAQPGLESPHVKQFVFDVVHKPDDDITAISKISIEGCSQ